jgi:hypothetical protein
VLEDSSGTLKARYKSATAAVTMATPPGKIGRYRGLGDRVIDQSPRRA